MATRRIQLEVDLGSAGLRLDQAISRLCPELSRSEARRLIARGGVFLGKRRTKVASRTVREHQVIEVHAGPLPEASRLRDLPAPTVVRLTADYLVADKPSGVVTAPTAQTDQFDLKTTLEKDYGPLHLVHRLDAPTSGLIIFARSQRSAASLSAQLVDRTLHRRYRAILVGHLAEPGDELEVTIPIREQQAHTTFRIQERKGDLSLVTATLHTGRTHQIRIHAAESGSPIAGDSKYGRRILRGHPKPPRLALHAEALTFVEPGSREVVTCHSEFPEILEGYFRGMC